MGRIPQIPEAPRSRSSLKGLHFLIYQIPFQSRRVLHILMSESLLKYSFLCFFSFQTTIYMPEKSQIPPAGIRFLPERNDRRYKIITPVRMYPKSKIGERASCLVLLPFLSSFSLYHLVLYKRTLSIFLTETPFLPPAFS